MNIAINGFGRIGRLVLRSLIENMKQENLHVTVINSPSGPAAAAHLLKYDSVHGRLNVDVSHDNDAIYVDNKKIHVISQKNLSLIDWQQFNVHTVLECSGKFNDRNSALQHIQNGAKKVIISAPAKDVDITVVYGVNHHLINSQHHLISCSSCTTNCLLPLLKVLDDNVGVQKASMTTIHSYTTDQRLLDNSHNDLKRARAASLSIVPTSTGAAKSVALIMPHLANKVDGIALRVPTPNVSLVNLSLLSHKNTSTSLVNDLFRQASLSSMQNIIDFCDVPLVSVDFNHSLASAVFDATQTQVVDGNLLHIAAWYDNEWAFATRMLDISIIISKM